MTQDTPTTDPHHDEVMETAGDLTKAADVITERGLHRGYFAAPDRIHGPVDARGAINVAINGNPENCGPEHGRAYRAALALIQHLGAAAGDVDHDDSPDLVAVLADWSDHPGRTKAEVADAMRACAWAMVEDAAQWS